MAEAGTMTTTALQTGATFETRRRREQVQLGLWMFLGTVTMLFAAFTSAYLVRRGSLDWQTIVLPTVLWVNTAALATSSLALEGSRWAGHGGHVRAARVGMLATIVLGVGFLVGQVWAWQELASQGVFVPTNPYSSFFYILTGVHALHLTVGLVLLSWALRSLFRRSGVALAWEGPAATAATFWHFFGGVWLYLFFLLSTY